jgi:small-conductance mechanosensitive channel
VPNENLLTSEITNWSYEGDRKIRLRLPVQISYDDDPDRRSPCSTGWRASTSACCRTRRRGLPLGFGDNGVDLELRVWIDDPDNRGQMRNELYLKIWDAFRAAGITIPFPQRDVYIKDFPGTAPLPAGAKPGNRAGSARGRKPADPAKPPD